MDMKMTLESICFDIKTLQNQIKKEEVNKKIMEDTLRYQERELWVAQNSTNAKGIIEENNRLRKEVDDLVERLESSRVIIDNLFIILEYVRKDIKPFFGKEHIVELYKQNHSVHRLAQLCGEPKSVVINILKDAGVFRGNFLNTKGDKKIQREDEQRERE